MNHFRPITRMPEQAQTSNFILKKEFAQDIINRLLSIQRTLPWGIYRPPGGVGDE